MEAYARLKSVLRARYANADGSLQALEARPASEVMQASAAPRWNQAQAREGALGYCPLRSGEGWHAL
jgi:hypothetical protein